MHKVRFNKISIHFLYTEEDSDLTAVNLCYHISIHFLYTEEDIDPIYKVITGDEFQSTSSIQRKTFTSSKPFFINIISIHFLYTEEDRKYQQMNILHQDILYLILT